MAYVNVLKLQIAIDGCKREITLKSSIRLRVVNTPKGIMKGYICLFMKLRN
jgi:hypothetical protein